MALTERTLEDKIEIIGDFKQIHVRTATVIERDGQEITRTFHRHVLSPNDDVSDQSSEVQGIAAAVWTDAIREAYIESITDNEGSLGEPTANTGGQ